MTVTNRIKTIESLVPHGTRLLDVGSDHALLPISLYKRGVIVGAVITDINRGPLLRSKEQLATLCPELLERAELVLSDGFANVRENSYDLAAVCGMGGELIAKIIEEAGEKAHCPLILQPMSQHDRLRAFLWSNGFAVRNELYTCEGKRVYAVFDVCRSAVKTDFDFIDLHLGKLRPSADPSYRAYCKKVCASAEKRLTGALKANDAQTHSALSALIKTATALAADD